MRRRKEPAVPGVEQLRKELRRTNYNIEYRRVLRSTVSIIVIVAAVAILIAVLCLPVIQVNGSSMVPSLAEGDILVCLATKDIQVGDIVCFYVGNRLLVKRCIALPGQQVDMDEQGRIFVDGQLLSESYVSEFAVGECNIDFPYQVPDNRIFCIGDNRGTSVDSRNTAVGCVSEEQLVGKVLFRVWPIPVFGPVS